MLYGSEYWIVNKADRRQVDALDQCCLRMILDIRWHAFVSNADVCHTPLSSSVRPSPLLDNIRVMVIVWRLRGNIIRTALCWIVWHNVHS